ncbi:ABC transporter substrate-binding protein [Siculibacillus lacustris]|uniref:ABC transporter substrate-binding protein n=1 Tax=Siculibacillus lacustris TaxID=1549641 RepID=UPI0013F15088|nr:ABC transporter substrate-binding protein [Siculibacillus lacustris]
MTDDAVWYTRCPLPTAFSVAVHTGRLAEPLARHGVAVHSIRHSPSAAVRLSHFTHTLPGQMRHGGHIPPLWSRSEGRDVRLLGLSWTDEAQLVLTLPESGIVGLADLRGRRLAVPRRPHYPIDFWRATVVRGWETALALVGLRLADVTLVDIDLDQRPFAETTVGTAPVSPPGTAVMTLSSQRDEAKALIRGEVDAVFSPGHYGVALKAFLGAHVVADLARDLPDPRDRLNNPTLLALTVEGAFLDRRPDAVTEVLVGVLRASAWARSHRAETARIVAAESGNAEELVEEIFGVGFADDLAPSLDDDRLEALARQGAFLAHHGFIPRQVAAAEWVEPSPLRRALDIVAEDEKRAEPVRSVGGR